MEAPKGGLGRKRGDGRWRTVLAKRASGAERAGNIDHTAITVNRSNFESATYKTGGGWRILRVSLTGETALSRSFGRSEGNGTSQLLVKKLRDEETGTS